MAKAKRTTLKSADTVTAEATKEVPGITVFGAINKPTPKWATWLFRIFYHATTALAVWLAATKLVPEGNKV